MRVYACLFFFQLRGLRVGSELCSGIGIVLAEVGTRTLTHANTVSLA